MWEQEFYDDDDDAALAEAIRRSTADAAASSAAASSAAAGGDSSDDNDDDFVPEDRPRPQRGRRPRAKPRVAAAPRPSSPGSLDDHDGDIDIGDSAVPTPDLAQLQVASSPGAGLSAADTDDGDSSAVLGALRQREQAIRARITQLESEIAALERKCGVEGSGEAQSNSGPMDLSEFRAPEWSVPIRANVMNFEWDRLGAACQFDVILMDPPWQLASQAPTRGVAIAYQQLPDICIESLPIHLLQTNGFIFIWVINNKYTRAFQLMKQWGYRYVDDITWVKQTVNRRMAKGHGYYLQHAKETCLVGKKGLDPPTLQRSVASDVIFSERRGQSQKPEELYEIIEQLVPGGNYLEIFGRKNNLRDYWVTVGNEL
ncbi:hypothetical protein GGF46_004700 [Coemansia sp. RSA 552]|nr:hypothetical protein GGF46_004700 [Coemansia sp. RSA 552]